MSRHRESAKLQLRKLLQRVDVGIGTDPATKRLVRTLASLQVDHVLDVGANEGQFAALLRSAGYKARIDSFEPLPEAYATLEKRATKDTKWATHQYGLGEASGSANINVSANSFSSSILQMTPAHVEAAPESAVIGTTNIDLRALDDLQFELDIQPQRALLKIDTQGYEHAVLAGAKTLLSSIAAVQLELSLMELYSGQMLFDDLRQIMSDHGLELFSLEAGIADQHGRLLQCDGIFVNRALLAALY